MVGLVRIGLYLFSRAALAAGVGDRHRTERSVVVAQGSRDGRLLGVRKPAWLRVEALWVGALALCAAGMALALQPIQTTRNNFFVPGTQPLQFSDGLQNPFNCAGCHEFDPDQQPFTRWNHSMMAQSTRDPVFQAALAISEQDAAFVGESCLRCHAPMTWLNNRVKFDEIATSPNFGKSLALQNADERFGVACIVCHRMVDPIYSTGTPGDPQDPGSPPVDANILAGLSTGIPPSAHNASMIIDPQDRRRGPYDLQADWLDAYPPNPPDPGGWPGFHEFLRSPFHQSSRMCATCHDVSSSHFTKQTNGSYALNGPGQAPAPSKYDQFPEQRTFSEWAQSQFASGPVNLAGRFGGTQSYSSCQDCHMPDTTGQGCILEPPVRTDLPLHNFNGANTWVLRGVRAVYDDSETYLTEQGVEDSIARSVTLLRAASDLQVTQQHGFVNARIINFSGHKLPTGYNEGRRMWINVKFRSLTGGVIAERGAYDQETATLTENDTKVYEAKMGPDATVAALLGVPEGPAFRLAISNKLYKDNRIPPMGFTNAGFAGVQAGSTPAGLYADGQYWDDTRFSIPAGARSADVAVYYQTSSRQYMEFLRDANTSPDHGAGQIAYNTWVNAGKSAPAEMDIVRINLKCRCDWDGDDNIRVGDIFAFLTSWFRGDGDFSGDGASTVSDIFQFLTCWFASCAGY